MSTMSCVKYTKEDLKLLGSLSNEGSIAKTLLEDCDYDPDKFEESLIKYKVKKDMYYLYEVPLKEIPLLIYKGSISGILKFRLQVGK